MKQREETGTILQQVQYVTVPGLAQTEQKYLIEKISEYIKTFLKIKILFNIKNATEYNYLSLKFY